MSYAWLRRSPCCRQLGHLEPLFERPGTLACVQRVRELTKVRVLDSPL